MSDYLKSLTEFQNLFPDEDACATWLFELRWPDGFECPACGHKECCALRTRKWTYQCKSCQKQTSVRAGTLMHASNLPLTTWFWAAYLVATHSNGISGFQLQKQLGLGSYRTAWLLLGKLRSLMVDPGRNTNERMSYSFFWDAKLFHSGSNSGTPWHLKKGIAHVLVGITHCQGWLKLTKPRSVTAPEMVRSAVGESTRESS